MLANLKSNAAGLRDSIEMTYIAIRNSSDDIVFCNALTKVLKMLTVLLHEHNKVIVRLEEVLDEVAPIPVQQRSIATANTRLGGKG